LLVHLNALTKFSNFYIPWPTKERVYSERLSAMLQIHVSQNFNTEQEHHAYINL